MGEWETFIFEIVETDGTQHTITIGPDDLRDLDWQDVFDWLDDWAEDHDVDYDNGYGENT